MGNHRRANHFFLPVHASCELCQVQCLFKKVGYTAYFGVDHQNLELEGDLPGFHLKEQVHESLQAHQCSISKVAPNPSIRELSPWLRISRWHELAVNHIIPASTPLHHIKQASVLPNPIDGESNLDRLPLMVRAYLENAQAVISRAPYHLRRLVVSVEDSPVATVGLNHLWVPSTISKYCMLMTKLFVTMVRSRDSSPVDDKSFVNVLGDLHSDLGDALENLISYIRSRQDADRDDEDLVRIHTVLLHICRPPTCPVVQHRPPTSCPIIRFLIVNSLKSDPSSTNPAFEHVRHVTGPVAILEYWWRCTILMQLVRPMWQPDHPAIPRCEADEWLACIRDDTKDTPFNRLRETMRLACTVLGDGPDIPRLVWIGAMACTINGQAVTIDTLRNLVSKLLGEANKVMSDQLLLGLHTAWIGRVIAEGNVVDRANEGDVGYSFLSDARNEFHRHGQDLAIHLFSDQHTRGLFIKGTNDDRSIIWNQNALTMWARAADCMHALLFLLMHFTADGPPRGEEYSSYLIRNTEHSDRTFYWSAGTIMTFQRYHKGANAGLPVKLIPRFLPPQLNLLFIEYMLLVRPVQSFIAGLRRNMDAARQYMNLWAIERDAAMDGEDVSRLVAGAFLEHANLDIGIADYRHLAAYFSEAIKQSYCTEFPIDETLGHSSATAARHYANCSNDHRFMDR
jgi:hypothetical protein